MFSMLKRLPFFSQYFWIKSVGNRKISIEFNKAYIRLTIQQYAIKKYSVTFNQMISDSTGNRLQFTGLFALRYSFSQGIKAITENAKIKSQKKYKMLTANLLSACFTTSTAANAIHKKIHAKNTQ